MELNQYRYFLTVASTGSFQLAADKLFITRQAISQSVIQMEKSLGYPLFLRTRTGLVLTKEGELFLPRIKSLVSIQEQMESDMHRCSEKSPQVIRLYYTNTTYSLYEDSLLEFQRQCEGEFHLHLEGCQESDCCRLMHEAKADIIISTFIPRFEGCRTKLLVHYPLCLMMSEGHRLAGKDDISIQDLAGETFLAYVSGDKGETEVCLPDCLLTGVENGCYDYSNDLIYLFHRVRNNRGLLLGVTENLRDLLKGVVYKPFPQAGDWNHYFTVSDSFTSRILGSDFSDRFFKFLSARMKPKGQAHQRP